MNEKLDRLLKETMRLVGFFAGKNDADAIGRLAETARKLERMKQDLAEMETETNRIEQTLGSYESRDGSSSVEAEPEPPEKIRDDQARRRGERKKIRIVIDWNRLGIKQPTETICEHGASGSLGRFVERLYETKGLGALEKLANFRVSRGPFVSRSPQRDFRNRANGTSYQHQAVRNTGFYVLTHSTTQEKVQAIENACRFLGFVAGAVTVAEASKNEYPGDVNW